MKYYKFLSFDSTTACNEIRTFIYANKNEFMNKPLFKWHNVNFQRISRAAPTLLSTFAEQGFTVKWVAFFITHVHEDNIHVDDVKETYRINLPILNCENTETRFYKSKVEPEKITRFDGLTHYRFNPSECTQIDSITVNQPVILNVKTPHAVVVNHTNFPRITATIAVHEDLSTLMI